jgi:tetratricopeptide (TPR) repeat protein
MRQVIQAGDALQIAQAAFDRFMAQGNDAFRNKRYLDAVANFNEALRLRPTDPGALAGLDSALRAIERDKRALVDVDAILKQAALELSNKQYADAIRHYNDVLKQDSDNRRALDGLRQARYAKDMDDGQRAMLAQKYTDAIKAFEDALVQRPGDPAASSLLQQAKLRKKPF